MRNAEKLTYYAKARGTSFVRGFDTLDARNEWVAARPDERIAMQKRANTFREIKNGKH